MTKRLRNHSGSLVRSIGLAVTLALFTALSASPARADRCEDTAKQLASGSMASRSASPQPTTFICRTLLRRTALGRRGKNFSVELYAKGDRKPKPEFFKLVAASAAIIFTVPKDDTETGTARCIKRMGILCGDKDPMRFRRLNMECTRTKTDASIVVTRDRDD